MKKTILIITGFFIALQWSCRLEEVEVPEVPEVNDCSTFERTYNYNAEFFSINDIAATPDGNFILCGGTGEDILLMKIDKEGNEIFTQIDDTPGIDEGCNSIVVTPDGGFLVCGNRESRAYFQKYNAEGVAEIDNLFPEVGSCNCLIDANDGNDGNYVFSGRIKHNNNIINSYVGNVRLLSDTIQFLEGYLAPPRPEQERASSIIASPNGYAVVGFSRNSQTYGTTAVAHFYRLYNDLSIVPESEKFHHPGNQNDIATAIVATNDNHFMITGDLEISQGADAFALKVDQDGNNVLLKQYGGAGRDFGKDIIAAHENNQYIITGHSPSFGSDNSNNFYLLNIDNNGEIIWQKSYGQVVADEYATAVIRADDCGYIVVGMRIENGLSSPYIIKVDENGNID